MDYPNTIDKAIDTLSKMIKSYYEKCESLTIDELHRLQDRMTTVLYFVSEEESKLKKDYNFARFYREISFSRIRMSYRKKDYNGGDSDSMANQDLENDKAKELEIEAFAYTLQSTIKRVDKIVTAINQRISTLKKEMETIAQKT